MIFAWCVLRFVGLNESQSSLGGMRETTDSDIEDQMQHMDRLRQAARIFLMYGDVCPYVLFDEFEPEECVSLHPNSRNRGKKNILNYQKCQLIVGDA